MTWRPTEATLFVEKTVAPTANDDQNEGFLVGDLWLDETNDKAYLSLDVTAGAAVWVSLMDSSNPVLTGFTTGSVLFIKAGSIVGENNSAFFFEEDNGYGKLAVGDSAEMRNTFQAVREDNILILGDIKALITARNKGTTDDNFVGFSMQTLDTGGNVHSGVRLIAQLTSHALNAVSADLIFETRNAGTRSEKMRLSSEGNLSLSNIVAGVADYDKFLVSDGGILKYRTGAELLGDIEGTPTADWNQNGFENRTDSSITFTDGTRTFSIQPTGANFNYWVAGTKYTSTGDTVVITDVEGIHAIYYDGSTLTALANPTSGDVSSIIRTKAFVSILYWDTSAVTAIYVGEERHGVSMAPSTHSYLHFTKGLSYESGLGLNTISIDGNGTANAHAQFGIDSGTVYDEDLYLTPAAVAAATGLPIYYMLGASAEWQKYTNAGFSVRTFDGTTGTRLAYNQYTGGAWQLTEVGNLDFVLCHVFATTEKDKPIIAFMGQATYATLRLARAGANVEVHNLLLDDILFPEIKPIATLIFKTGTAYTNDVKGAIVSTDEGDEYVDWRDESISKVSVTSSDHNSLTGIQGGGATERYHLTNAQVAEIAANTLKETNVSTDLSEGTPTETTVDVDSSDGSNATLVSASVTRAGLLTKAKFDEIVANTSAKHTEGDDQALGALGTKNPPVDADKTIYRDSASSDALVTSTWTQVKAFLKTYFDTLYQAVNTAILKTVFTTKGDILVTTGASTPTRLGVGSNTHVLTADSTEASGVKWTAGSGSASSYVKVSDVKAAGTSGGTFTSGAWQTRILNTEDSDPDSICSLSSNQITLTAGTYECSIFCPAAAVDSHQAKLRNTTGSVDLLLGTMGYTHNGYYGSEASVIRGRFTIAASQALEVQHRCQTTKATNGFGAGQDFGVSNVFAIAEFWKVG